MRVDVDEAGGDDAALDVDDACRRGVDRRRDGGNRVALDREVPPEPGAAGAVDDPCVREEEIVGDGLPGERREQQEEGDTGLAHERDSTGNLL